MPTLEALTRGISDPGAELAVEHLHTLSYAASFIRNVGEDADSIAVSLPPLEREAERALERACELAVGAGSLEAEISFSSETTIVRFARPGRL